MKRVALYIRVSTDQQAKHGDSLREQQDTLQEYVDSQKDMIVSNTYIDDGISGQKLQRDEFQRLLDDVKQDEIDIILFTKLDRWFRNLRHYLNTQEILDKHNVSWNAVSQQYYDTTTAYGRTFIAQVMSFAELEAQMTSERIKAVFENKIKQGEVVSGKVPLGYSIANKKLVPNKDKEIVVDLFNYYLIKNNLRATVRFLYDKYDIARDYQSVKHMLSNEKYIGYHRGVNNYCEPIIDRHTFDSVQSLLTKNIKSSAKRTYIFSSLLVCACCGKKLSGQMTYPKYTKKDGTVTANSKKVYKCPTRKNRKDACALSKSIYENNIEKYLIENLRNEVNKLNIADDKVKKETNNIVAHNKKINSKLTRLKEAYLNEIISLNEYKVDKEKLESKLKTEENTNVIQMKRYNFKLPKGFEKEYTNRSDEAKRLLWRSIIDKLIIDKDGNVSIVFL